MTKIIFKMSSLGNDGISHKFVKESQISMGKVAIA
jgi:hypothetical protein